MLMKTHRQTDQDNSVKIFKPNKKKHRRGLLDVNKDFLYRPNTISSFFTSFSFRFPFLHGGIFISTSPTWSVERLA